MYVYTYKNKSNKWLCHDIVVITLDLHTHSKSNHNHVYYDACVSECATRLYAYKEESHCCAFHSV